MRHPKMKVSAIKIVFYSVRKASCVTEWPVVISMVLRMLCM